MWRATNPNDFHMAYGSGCPPPIKEPFLLPPPHSSFSLLPFPFSFLFFFFGRGGGGGGDYRSLFHHYSIPRWFVELFA